MEPVLCKSSDVIRISKVALPVENNGFPASFLFETIISDAQWSALNIGTFAILMNACSGTSTVWSMWPWRHALNFDSRPMQLALRYYNDLGMPEATARVIGNVYASMDKLAVRSAPMISHRAAYTANERYALANLATDWRALCGETIAMLKLLDPLARNRLSNHYTDNSKILQQVLEEGAFKNSNRVNQWGEIELPVLAQQRRQVRLKTQTLCKLHVGGQIVSATLLDLSQSGAGISCRTRLDPGQSVAVEFGDGRTIRATVAWSTEARCGLAFDILLSQNDVMIAGQS